MLIFLDFLDYLQLFIYFYSFPQLDSKFMEPKTTLALFNIVSLVHVRVLEAIRYVLIEWNELFLPSAETLPGYH